MQLVAALTLLQLKSPCGVNAYVLVPLAGRFPLLPGRQFGGAAAGVAPQRWRAAQTLGQKKCTVLLPRSLLDWLASPPSFAEFLYASSLPIAALTAPARVT